MKKVILALAIVSVSFAACNDGAKKEETPAVDSPKVEAPAVDTAAKAPVADTAAKAPAADTAAKK